MHRRRLAYDDGACITVIGTSPETKTFGSALVAETVRLTVGHHGGAGAPVLMVTVKDGLWGDSPPALATVLVIV